MTTKNAPGSGASPEPIIVAPGGRVDSLPSAPRSPNRYIYLRVLQGYYASAHGWEDIGEADSASLEEMRALRDDLRAYRANAPEYAYRIIKRREPNPLYPAGGPGGLRRLTAAELAELTTISSGHFDNTKMEGEDARGRYRVLLSRCGIADGMPYDNGITVERLVGGCWEEAAAYPGGPIPQDNTTQEGVTG